MTAQLCYRRKPVSHGDNGAEASAGVRAETEAEVAFNFNPAL